MSPQPPRAAPSGRLARSPSERGRRMGRGPTLLRDPAYRGRGPSTASQTSWALMGLLSVGEHSEAVRKGIAYLVDTQHDDGTWDEPWFTGTGFPGILLHQLPPLSSGVPADGARALLARGGTTTAELEVLTPLRIESFAFGGADTIIGAGREQGAKKSGAKLAARLDEHTAVALVGVAGGLAPELTPGDIIIASELRSTESSTSRNIPGSSLLSAEFRRARFSVYHGPLVTSPTYVPSGDRAELAASGALAVDMESSWVMDYSAEQSTGRRARDLRHQYHAVRCAEGYARSGHSPRPALHSSAGRRRAASTRSSSPRRDRFAQGSSGPSRRSSERSSSSARRSTFDARSCTTCTSCVASRRLGAIFVEELDEVPDEVPDAVVVLAAHGVSSRGQTTGCGARAASPSSTRPVRWSPKCTPKPAATPLRTTTWCSSGTQITKKSREPSARHPSTSPWSSRMADVATLDA